MSSRLLSGPDPSLKIGIAHTLSTVGTICPLTLQEQARRPFVCRLESALGFGGSCAVIEIVFGGREIFDCSLWSPAALPCGSNRSAPCPLPPGHPTWQDHPEAQRFLVTSFACLAVSNGDDATRLLITMAGVVIEQLSSSGAARKLPSLTPLGTKSATSAPGHVPTS